MTSTNDIRRYFLDYFGSEGHRIVPSAPLVPHNDPTLMFIQSEIGAGSGGNQPFTFRRNAFRQGRLHCPETVQPDHRVAAAHKMGAHIPLIMLRLR